MQHICYLVAGGTNLATLRSLHTLLLTACRLIYTHIDWVSAGFSKFLVLKANVSLQRPCNLKATQ